MKKIVLFTVMLAFITGTSVAVSSFYQSEVNSAVENSISNDGEKEKKEKESKDEKAAKEDKTKAKDCSSKESCCKKSSKSCEPKDAEKKKDKE